MQTRSSVDSDCGKGLTRWRGIRRLTPSQLRPDARRSRSRPGKRRRIMARNCANESRNLIELIEEASNRIYRLARETPLIRFPRHPRLPESVRVFAKMEQQQVTGSFKVRGAANKIFSLARDVSDRGVVTSSTGNHGLGVAAAARSRGIDAEVFLSSKVPEGKWKKIESFGARIRMVGENPLEAELLARAAATDTGRTYISPYNDWQVIAGQGT